MNVLKTILVPNDMIDIARQLAREITPAGNNMFISGYSENGLEPATYYISSGLIDEKFASAMDTGLNLHAAAEAGALAQGIPKIATEAQAIDLVNNAIVHTGKNDNGEDETPQELIARMGLKPTGESIEI